MSVLYKYNKLLTPQISSLKPTHNGYYHWSNNII